MILRPYSDNEWNSLPHVILTSEVEWDQSVLDLDIEDDQEWYDAISDDPECPSSQLYDAYGDYMKRVNINLTSLEDHVDACTLYHTSTAHVHPSQRLNLLMTIMSILMRHPSLLTTSSNMRSTLPAHTPNLFRCPPAYLIMRNNNRSLHGCLRKPSGRLTS